MSDLRRETLDKQRPWRRITHRYVYAVPQGMMFPEDMEHVFSGCGLWWVSENGVITVKKRAKLEKEPEPPSQRLFQSLAYRATRIARR